MYCSRLKISICYDDIKETMDVLPLEKLVETSLKLDLSKIDMFIS